MADVWSNTWGNVWGGTIPDDGGNGGGATTTTLPYALTLTPYTVGTWVQALTPELKITSASGSGITVKVVES